MHTQGGTDDQSTPCEPVNVRNAQTAVYLATVYGTLVHNTNKHASKRYLCWARAQMRCIPPHQKNPLTYLAT